MPTLKSPAMQRAATLLHLPPLLAEFGVNLEDVFTDTGVSPADITPDAYVPFASYVEILDRAAKLTRCSEFGLRLGKRQNLMALGPLGRLMSHAATLGEALADFVNFQIGNSTGGAAYLHRHEGDFGFGFGIYDPGAKVSNQSYDLILAAGCNFIQELTADTVVPLEMLAIRRVPKDLAPYRALANCPIRFDQSQTCLILSGRSMEFKLKNADRKARERILAELHQRLTQAPWGVAGRVKHELRGLMLVGSTSLQDMADHLDLHPRSLRRYLEREGTTFEAIKDEIRYAVARELLTLTQLPALDVGMSLDYSTPSSFIHAFQRWSGMSPSQWRRKFRRDQSDQ